MADIDYDALVEAVINRFMMMNASTVTINGKTYRNLEAQVRKNQEDIQDLDLETLATLPGRVTDLETTVGQHTTLIGQLNTQVNLRQLKCVKRTVSLPILSWVNNQVTVTVAGVTDSNLVQVSPDPTSFEEYSGSGVYCSSQNTDVLTFAADSEPATDLTVNVVIWN